MGDEKRKQSADFVSKWECSSLIIIRFYSVILILCGKRFFLSSLLLLLLCVSLVVCTSVCMLLHPVMFLLLNCSRYALNLLALYTFVHVWAYKSDENERERELICVSTFVVPLTYYKKTHILYSMFTYWFTQLE